ncbi:MULTISPECIES: adenylate/guanylate cyclase domain-containing protein [Nostocales]|nr:adenylate/guanylate cyclase domain-containing protein [Tolypothrix bouteillei]KAF3887061.1 adenylate/guanylate cyclase domain-containing protein [Tolypothrix bouteillei VB521301]
MTEFTDDSWGDTLNIALPVKFDRLPGKIQLGKILVKGKGEMMTGFWEKQNILKHPYEFC